MKKRSVLSTRKRTSRSSVRAITFRIKWGCFIWPVRPSGRWVPACVRRTAAVAWLMQCATWLTSQLLSRTFRRSRGSGETRDGRRGGLTLNSAARRISAVIRVASRNFAPTLRAFRAAVDETVRPRYSLIIRIPKFKWAEIWSAWNPPGSYLCIAE